MGQAGVPLRSGICWTTFTDLCDYAHRLISLLDLLLFPQSCSLLLTRQSKTFQMECVCHSHVTGPPTFRPHLHSSLHPNPRTSPPSSREDPFYRYVGLKVLSEFAGAVILFYFIFLAVLIPVCFCSHREHQAHICPHTLMSCMGKREPRALEDPSLLACQDNRTLPNLVRESGKEGVWSKQSRG